MPASICAFILTLSTLCGSRVVSGILNSPRNVRLTSYNMDLVMRWDPPEGAPSGLIYTTVHKTPVLPNGEGCVNISRLECDFTSLNIHILEYGIYTGMVRAQLGSESSDWVESNNITLDKDTIIGSPNVSLSSNGDTIEVSIEDPVFFGSATLRSVYSSATFNVTYWKDDQRKKAKSISNIQQNRMVLSDLDIWTKYCVQVQIDLGAFKKFSELSKPVCVSTTNKEGSPWVAAVVAFCIVVAVGVALVVVIVVYRKSISHFLCPKDVLPQHFKEYLLAPPNSSMYVAMENSRPPEEIYHQISIITDGKTVEEGRPPEAAETSCSKQPSVTEEER